MKTIPLAFASLVCLAIGCTQAQGQALSADGLSLLNCVAGDAISGMTVEATALACGVAVVGDVVSILDAAHITPVSSPALTAYRLQHPVSASVVVKATK
jgi:hypothetical protein